jgi:hypothetical protein
VKALPKWRTILNNFEDICFMTENFFLKKGNVFQNRVKLLAVAVCWVILFQAECNCCWTEDSSSILLQNRRRRILQYYRYFKTEDNSAILLQIRGQFCNIIAKQRTTIAIFCCENGKTVSRQHVWTFLQHLLICVSLSVVAVWAAVRVPAIQFWTLQNFMSGKWYFYTVFPFFTCISNLQRPCSLNSFPAIQWVLIPDVFLEEGDWGVLLGQK